MAGIDCALHHPAEVRRHIADGQDLIARRFAPSVIGAQWERALGLAAG